MLGGVLWNCFTIICVFSPLWVHAARRTHTTVHLCPILVGLTVDPRTGLGSVVYTTTPCTPNERKIVE